MDNYILQWQSPNLGVYWHYNFIHVIYEKNMINDYIGTQESNIFIDCKDEYSFYIHNSEIDRIKKYAFEFYMNDQKYSEWMDKIKCLEKETNQIKWEIKKLNIDERIAEIESLEKKFHEAVLYHLLSQPHLTESLQEKFTLDIEILNQLCIFDKIPKVLIETKEWNKVVSKIKKHPNNKKIILNNHLKKWKYITAGDSKQPMNYKYLLNRFEMDKEKNIIDVKEDKRKYDLKIDEFNGKIVQRIKNIAYMRFVTKEIWMKLWYLIEQNLIKLS